MKSLPQNDWMMKQITVRLLTSSLKKICTALLRKETDDNIALVSRRLRF